MNVGIAILLLFVVVPVLTLVLTTGGRRARTAARLAVAIAAVLLLAGLALSTRSPGVGMLLLVGLVLVLPARRGGAPRRSLPFGRGGRRTRLRIDPSAVGGVWSRLLREAMSARDQFVATGRRAPSGAIRDQLTDLQTEVDHALAQAWDRARRGWELEGAAAGIAAAARAHRPRARWGQGWWVAPEEWRDPRVRDANRSRDEAAARLAAAMAEQRAQLQVLVARLGEAACSAAELSVAAGGVPAAVPGADRSRELVDRLTHLRAALTEATAA